MFAYPFCMLCTHLRTIVVLGASQVDICAPRGVLTLMAANWPLMSVNVFFCGLWWAMSVNGLATAQLWKWSLMACFARCGWTLAQRKTICAKRKHE